MKPFVHDSMRGAVAAWWRRFGDRAPRSSLRSAAWLLIAGSLVVVLASALLLSLARTTVLQVEAASDVVSIEFTPGEPLPWSLGAVALTECASQAAAAAPAAPGASEPMSPPVSMELVLTAEKIRDAQFDMVRATLVIDQDDLVISLAPLKRTDGKVEPAPTGCRSQPSRVAVVTESMPDTRATGATQQVARGLRLPAQLRINPEGLRNGLTLEFRGAFQVGEDLLSSRQPLLSKGRVVLRELRSRPLHAFTSLQFDSDQRELGLGDKVSVAVARPDDPAADMPRGFIRVTREQDGTHMSVVALGVAAQGEIVRPYASAERPRVNWVKRLARDDAFLAIVTLLSSLIGLCLALLQVVPAPAARSPE